MRIDIDDIKGFLSGSTMEEVILNRLNENGRVRHTITDTDIEVIAVLDADLGFKWMVLDNKKLLHDSVATENLQSTIEYIESHK